MLYGEEWLWSAYGRMLHSVQTGQAAFAHVHEMPFYEFLDTHSEPAMQFQAAMSAYSHLEATAIAAAYNFADSGTVVDVGGGDGTLLAVLLTAHPIFARCAVRPTGGGRGRRTGFCGCWCDGTCDVGSEETFSRSCQRAATCTC